MRVIFMGFCMSLAIIQEFKVHFIWTQVAVHNALCVQLMEIVLLPAMKQVISMDQVAKHAHLIANMDVQTAQPASYIQTSYAASTNT